MTNYNIGQNSRTTHTTVWQCEQETEHAAECLAKLCRANLKKLNLLFSGEIGCGKTTFIRRFAASLGVKEHLKSPTFAIIEEYQINDTMPLYHCDLYRLNDSSELHYIGWQEYLDRNAILLIEWPENGSDALPPADLHYKLYHRDQGRAVEITSYSSYGNTLLDTLIADAAANDQERVIKS